MNSKEYFELTKKMRELQKRYYKERSSTALYACKKVEKAVDAEIERVTGIVEQDGQLRFIK